MVGTIQKREQFLANIAKNLGRGQRTEGVSTPVYSFQPQYRILQEASQDELLQVLKEQCKSIHVDYFETTVNELGSKLEDIVQFYGGGPLSLWNDERFHQFGLQDLIETVLPINPMMFIFGTLQKDKKI